MEAFSYYSPTEIIFGKNTQKQVAKEIKKHHGSKVFIIYGGGSVIRTGHLKEVETLLKEEGISFESHGGVKPNPSMAFAIGLADAAISFGTDFVLAIGGGSVIDTAKAVAIGVSEGNGVCIEEIWKTQEAPEKSLPVGVILTISAAGSETSDSAVLTNEKTGLKKGLSSDINRPAFAIMNPELTFTLPRYQVACGAVDIYMHTLERYFSPKQGNDMTDEIAEGLMRNVIRQAPAAYKDCSDYHAMSELMWSGSLSHNGLTGLGGEKDFSVHGLGHVLSARYDVTHGASLSALWGSWARYVYELDLKRFARYADRVFGIKEKDDKEAALKAIKKTEEFFRSLDMPVCIRDLDIGELSDETLHEMAEEACGFGSRILGSLKAITSKEAYDIYKEANK